MTLSALSTLPPNFADTISVRGRLEHDAILGGKTWFHAGGTADWLFRPADQQDLQDFLQQVPSDMPITTIGVGSNVIIRDGGVRGVVIRLGQAFAKTEWQDDLTVVAGSAALDFNIAITAQRKGVGGMAFLSGIPGSIGGAVLMNAGAYGGDMAQICTSATLLRRDGRLENWTPEHLNFTYRHSDVPADAIIVAATLRGHTESPDTIAKAIDDIRERRHATQPVRAKTGGSTFANPGTQDLAQAGLPETTRAWQLIDAVGGRSLQVGGAHMSHQHCNFMLNDGTATATDLEKLGDTLIERVYERFGIRLRWEIKRIGDFPCPPANKP